MVTYKYSALSRSGQKVTGIVEGFNEMDAVDRIKREHSVVLKISEVKKSKSAEFMAMDLGGKKLHPKPFTVMCSQFAIILRAGIPIGRTVQLIADKTTDKTLKFMLQEISSDVEAGRSLSASFEERGGEFLPPTFVETIRAGEESGNIDKAFETMHEHYDKQVKLANRVRSALAYPAFVFVVAIVVVMVLMVKVVPVFLNIFESYDAELPLPTRTLIAASNFCRRYILIMLMIAILITIIYKIYSGTENGKLKIAKISMKLPVLGNIVNLSAASQFANSMTTMLGAGLPLNRALAITSRTIENYYISQEVSKLTVKLEEGFGLGNSLREAEILPDILVDMVGVGEETGELEDTLGTIGAYYDSELQVAIDDAMAKLEPAILVFLAGFAGYIVIAIYMAMFGMYAAM